jgi:hypothetical protein
VVNWLHQADKQSLCKRDLEAEIIESANGTFRIDAARIKGGQMHRIS